MYQQATSIVVAKPLDIKQQIKTETPMEETSFSEDSGEIIKIVKAISEYRSSLDKEDINFFANIVQEESKKHGYDWELILAIIKTESELDVRAISYKGAVGLMQLMPSTAKWLSPKLGLKYEGRDSLYDPEYNVKLGTHYLYIMHQQFGNIEKAITAYNAGPTRLARYLRQGKKLPSGYLTKVMGYYKELMDSPDEATG